MSRLAIVNFDHLSSAYFYRLKVQLEWSAWLIIVIKDENFIDRAQIARS
jgi:hypothetical protein